MSRSDIDRVEDRRPFYLYVDEFQNFATDSFATILSEARKYGLNLTVANQYISQMSETVRDAVFGNVGTVISFRVSADDSPILAKQFEPTFEPNDLLQMHNRNFIINMVINGEKAPAFNATTLTLPKPQTDNTGRIIENTRRYYSRPRADVEKEISDILLPPENLIPKKSVLQPQVSTDTQPVIAQQGSPLPPAPVVTEVKKDNPANNERKPRNRRPRNRGANKHVDAGDKPQNNGNMYKAPSQAQANEPRPETAPSPATSDNSTLQIRH